MTSLGTLLKSISIKVIYVCDGIEELYRHMTVMPKNKYSAFMITTSHPDETLEEVMEFAELFSEDKFGTKVEMVEL